MSTVSKKLFRYRDFFKCIIILLVEEAYSFVSKPPFILHIAVCG